MPPREPPTRPHPDGFKETINVPIAIPAWGAVCMIAGALFTSGTLYQKMDALIEGGKKNDVQVAVIREKQIVNTAILENNAMQIRNLETRMSNVERVIFERKP